MSAAIVVNLTAGEGRAGEVVPQVISALSARGIEVEVFPTRQAGDAEQLSSAAAKRGLEPIIAVGGDGTIHQVLNGIIGSGSGATMGLVPVGTENVFGKELGISRNVKQACDVIVTGKVKAFDVGCCNGRCFLTMAGIGYDAQVVIDVSARMKQWLRSRGFILTGFATFARWQPFFAHIRSESERSSLNLRVWEVLVSNATNFAGGVRIGEGASMQDGLLDILLFNQPSKWGFFKDSLLSLAFKRMMGRDVKHYRISRVQVTTDRSVPAQLDGEVYYMECFDIWVQPMAVKILVP